MTNLLSVNDAAGLLHVNRSQIHRLLDGGQLRGRTIGSQRVVFAESLNEYQLVRPRPGRPLEPAAAWAQLLASEPSSIEELGPLAATTRKRATARYCHVIPYRLDDVSADPAVIQSGAAGAAQRGAHVGAAGPAQVYLRDSAWDRFRRTHSIKEADGDLNLIVRVVPDDAWPFSPDDRVAPLIVCAVDTYSIADLRSAHEALDRIGAER